MNKIATLLLLLLIASCQSPAPSKEQAPPPPASPPVSTTPTAAPSATSTTPTQNSDTVAEKIKTYLTSSFLTGHLHVMTEQDRKFTLAQSDLNGDGLPEYFVRFNSTYFCGNGGCTILLLKNEIRMINRFTVISTPVYACNQKTDGWRNLMVESEGSFRDLVFQNGKYPGNPSVAPESAGPPSGDCEMLFDEETHSKVYSF